MLTDELNVWIPSNRAFKDGRPKGMDGLNEIIAQNRASRYKGAQIERENVEWCSWYILKAMRDQRWPAMHTLELAYPVRVIVRFVEANGARDVSNIVGGGLKYLLDALSRPRGRKLGTAAIYDDSPKWIAELETHVSISPSSPGIAVTVIRLEQ